MPPRAASLKIERPPKTLRELATDQLRRAIVTQHFSPGDHLVERDLCTELGVSRTSIREALRYLESEGLVVRTASRGLVVSSVTPDEARQIYEIRAAIEPAMALLFTERATARDLQDLEAAAQRIISTSRSKRITDNVSALDGFYAVVMRGADNDTARRILQGLHGRMAYLRAITFMRASDDHRAETITMIEAMVAAALKRDGQAFARRCRLFVERSAAFAAQVLLNEAATAD